MDKLVKKYPLGILLGFLLGVFVIHPFAMVFQELDHPDAGLEISRLRDAFSPLHLPMALFFGMLGVFVGAVVAFYIIAVSREKARVRQLEGLLPVCSYCKKIRDDEGKEKGTGEWYDMEHYLQRKTNADFTHGICPVCYSEFIEKEELRERQERPVSRAS